MEHPHVGEKEPTAVQNGGRELPWEASQENRRVVRWYVRRDPVFVKNKFKN